MSGSAPCIPRTLPIRPCGLLLDLPPTRVLPLSAGLSRILNLLYLTLPALATASAHQPPLLISPLRHPHCSLQKTPSTPHQSISPYEAAPALSAISLPLHSHRQTLGCTNARRPLSSETYSLLTDLDSQHCDRGQMPVSISKKASDRIDQTKDKASLGAIRALKHRESPLASPLSKLSSATRTFSFLLKLSETWKESGSKKGVSHGAAHASGRGGPSSSQCTMPPLIVMRISCTSLHGVCRLSLERTFSQKGCRIQVGSKLLETQRGICKACPRLGKLLLLLFST